MKKTLVACLLFMTSVAYAQSADPATFKSIFATQDVILQTDPHSAFWQGVRPVYAELDRHGRPVPHHRTEVRSRWTNSNLYLLFICPYQKLYLKPAPNSVEETNHLWNWDVAELFIGSDFRDIQRYKEFELSPQGEWLDLDIDLHLPDHTVGWTWNSGFQVTARIDPRLKIWYGAMRIPFTAIDKDPPAAGMIFRANLFRSQGPPEDQKLIAWQAPMTDTFHTPESFGRLELVIGR